MINCQGRQFCQNCFASLLKEVYYKRKEFAPTGSKFFPFKVDPFQRALVCKKAKQEVTRVVSLIKMAENLPSILSRLNRPVYTTGGIWFVSKLLILKVHSQAPDRNMFARKSLCNDSLVVCVIESNVFLHIWVRFEVGCSYIYISVA